MWPRLVAGEYRRQRGAPNRRAFRRLVESGPPPGVLAYVDGAPAGWCAIAPRPSLPRLERSRVMKPVDDTPVWSVTCFFIGRAHRGRGLTVRLLRAAMKLAVAHGARLVEGYPTDPRGKRPAAAFVWTGLSPTFARAGFREVARRSPTRPIVRRAVRAGARGG
jgi:GNAT superfamily N-acetyltransferase